MQTSIISDDQQRTYSKKFWESLAISNSITFDYNYSSNRLVADWNSWIGNIYSMDSIESLLQDYKVENRTGDITSGIESLLSLLMKDGIIIQNPDEIRHYLLQHQDMICIILPMCDKVREKFQHIAEISIDIYKDKEIVDTYIVIYIRQVEYTHEIIDIIDQISDKCEMLLYNKSGRLNITTDFKPPLKN